MALTKLKFKISNKKTARPEGEDLRQAFLRVIQARYGKKARLDVKYVRDGVVTVTTQSAPYRAELIWNNNAIVKEMEKMLETEGCVKKIAVYLE